MWDVLPRVISTAAFSATARPELLTRIYTSTILELSFNVGRLRWKSDMRRKRSLLILSVAVSLAGAATAAKPITLFSAGSTFIYPILGKWCAEYRKLHPGIQVSYEPIGSGHGIGRTLAGTVDFGASDGPLSDLQVQRAERKILHFPVVLGAVVPSYNLPGVTQEVRFTPSALAGIYLGTITRWNDPELVRANPDVHLPAHELSRFSNR
jgi:phosphate transport system substrate-binding protein